jgi:hypothetical protein
VSQPFIQTVSFVAEMSKPSLMDFIARTPADVYFLVIPFTGNRVFGIVISDDVLEYLTNEFTILSLELVPQAQISKYLGEGNCRKTGNESLLG